MWFKWPKYSNAEYDYQCTRMSDPSRILNKMQIVIDISWANVLFNKSKAHMASYAENVSIRWRRHDLVMYTISYQPVIGLAVGEM